MLIISSRITANERLKRTNLLYELYLENKYRGRLHQNGTKNTRARWTFCVRLLAVDLASTHSSVGVC